MNTFKLLIAIMLTGCALDTDPDPAPVPTRQEAALPSCTSDGQCEPGERCINNECSPDLYDHPCTDTQNDVYNCGACGNECPWGSYGIIWCEQGVCGGASGTPNPVEDHPCTDTSNDPWNCGACGNECPWGDPSSNTKFIAISCSAGVCGGTPEYR